MRLNALKSMITSAGEADSYVWISRDMSFERGKAEQLAALHTSNFM